MLFGYIYIVSPMLFDYIRAAGDALAIARMM